MLPKKKQLAVLVTLALSGAHIHAPEATDEQSSETEEQNMEVIEV